MYSDNFAIPAIIDLIFIVYQSKYSILEYKSIYLSEINAKYSGITFDKK